MCDPLSIAIVSGVASLASAGISYEGQQATLNAQKKSNDDWLAYQQKISADATAKNEQDRQQAAAAGADALKATSPASQEAAQESSAATLNAAMLKGTPAAPDANIAALSQDPANASVTKENADRVHAAAQDANARIAALAKLASYGSGFGAMGATAATALQNAGDTIKLYGDTRSGTDSAVGVARNVTPVTYTPGSDIAGTIAGSLANIAGSSFAASPTGQGLSKSIKTGSLWPA